MIDFTTLDKKQTIYLETIKIEALKNFVKDTLAKYGTKSKLTKANKVADIIWQKFEHLGYVTEHAHQQFVDIAIAAALLHNLFYVESDLTTLFKHRVVLNELANKHVLDSRLTDLVYEIIEAQLGENHPIPKIKPTPNSPASTFADAVWQVNSFKARV